VKRRRCPTTAPLPRPPAVPPQVTRTESGANGCDQGVFAAAVAYDKWVGRYLISAICDDYLAPKVLLAVSTSDSVTGYWALYSAPADNQPTSWKCPNGLRAWPDYSQARGGGQSWAAARNPAGREGG
jgi:hypothetical protein